MENLLSLVRPVLKRIKVSRLSFQNRFSSKNKNDDTVEAQAETFRIWMWSSAAGLALVVIASITSMASRSSQTNGFPDQTQSNSEQVSILDSVPDGYVIAPIEPTNLDALDSIFEHHGYVDLYKSNDGSMRGVRIAVGLPLVRAPKNPRRFAVLVPESQEDILATLNEPVLVILRKNPPIRNGIAKNKNSKAQSNSPLFREKKGAIEIIEEDVPEANGTETFQAGVKP